jgi:hypothetical protein
VEKQPVIKRDVCGETIRRKTRKTNAFFHESMPYLFDDAIEREMIDLFFATHYRASEEHAARRAFLGSPMYFPIRKVSIP